MNLSTKHAHKSKSLLQVLTPMMENSSSSEFETSPVQSSNNEYDEDYLLDLVDYDFSNDVEALPKDRGFGALDMMGMGDAKTIKYREFPVEDGYVRVPVSYPGLTITKMEPPDLRLWTAETAFKEQVKLEKGTELRSSYFLFTRLFRSSTCSSPQLYWALSLE